MGLLEKAALYDEQADGSARGLLSRAEQAAQASSQSPAPGKGKRAPRKKGGRGKTQPADIETLKETLEKAGKQLWCILLNAPPAAENRDSDYAKKLKKMASAAGKVLFLPADRFLFVTDREVDTELLAHRFSSSLRMETLETFNGKSGAEVLSALAPGL